MPKPLTFHRWLMDQMDRDDEIGELSRQCQTDHRMDGLNLTEAKMYFRGRLPEVRLLLDIAGDEYNAYKKSFS